VAQEFLEALRGGNPAAQRLLTTKVSPVATANLPGTEHFRLQFLRGRIDRVVVQHNDAIAHYTLLYEERSPVQTTPAGPLDLMARKNQAAQMDGQKGTLLLRREDGRWRLWGTSFPVEDDRPGPTFDWEIDAGVPLLSPEEAEAFRVFEELAAVDSRQWDASWQVNLDLKDVPARDALGDLARGLGLPLRLDGLPPMIEPPSPSALDRLVALQLRGRSRLQAVEEVCRQAGVQPRYDFNDLRITVGQRTGPVAFAGPFLVEAVRVQEFFPHPTGALTLRAVTGRLPAPVAELFHTDARPLRIDAITAADGRDLYHAANQPFYKPLAGPVRGGANNLLPQKEHVIPLRNLLRDLNTVHQVRGRLPVLLPVRVDVIRFDRLAPGVVGQAGDVRLTVRQINSGSGAGGPSQPARPALEFDAQGINGKGLTFAVSDALGRKLACGEPQTPRPDLVRFEVPGDPATVVFKVKSLQEVEYPFELRDIPLRRVAERLEPARFPGHEVPVSVEFLAIVPAQNRPGSAKFPAVRLQLHNHCQKSVERVHLRLAYLDAEGRPQKEGERTAAFFQSDWKLKILEPGKPFEVEEPDLPAGAVKATVTVTAVGFADGTGWPP
jgi:hypothetical protein